MSALLPHRWLHDASLRRRWLGLWALLILVVGVAALTPGDAAPTLSSSDKFDHLLAFGALAVAGTLSRPAGRRAAAFVALAMIGYGGFIECAQTFVPGRFGDWADLVADAVGVALGLALVALLRRVWPAA